MLQTEEKWAINDRVRFSETPEMGLGVVATRDIDANTEILRDPVRTFTGHETAVLRETSAYHLLFVDRDTYAPGGGSALHLVVGPISMVNHDKNPNCIVDWSVGYGVKNPHAKLITTRKIPRGAQIFISYHNIDEYDFD